MLLVEHVIFIILPEVIQVIPAIKAESQGVFLKTQSAEKLPYGLGCTLEDRYLRRNKADLFISQRTWSHVV